MKKRWLLLLIPAFLVLLAACGSVGYQDPAGSAYNDPKIPALTTDTGWWVNMTGDRISKETLAVLQAESKAIEKDGFQLGGAIVLDCSSDQNKVTTKFINDNGIGAKGVDNGIGIVVFLDKKGSDGNKPAVYIGTGKGIEAVLNDAKVGRFLDQYYVPARKEGNWEAGLLTTVQKIHQYLLTPDAEEFKSPPEDYTWLYILIIILVIFLLLDGGFNNFALTSVLIDVGSSGLGGGGGGGGGGAGR